MKMKKITILSALALVAATAFNGCKKDDGPIRSSITIDAVPTITTNIDATGSQAIDLLNLPTFSGKFKVSMYFSNATPPTKVDVVVRRTRAGVATIKTYKTDVTLPQSYTVTAAELAALFGEAIVLNDTYDFGPNITVNGKVYEAFPQVAGAVGTGPGLATGPGYSEYARFGAICAYNPDIYVGDFTAKDAWGDADGATITLTKVDATHFSFLYPSVDNPKPVVVTVNTANNNVTIPLTTIGTQWKASYGYPATATYANPSVNSATGSVTPCDKVVTLNIQWGTNSGSLQFSNGPYKLVLTKKG